jgi:hypothetical protein
MTKLLTIAAILITLATTAQVGTARAGDVLFVAIEDSKGDRSMHYQVSLNCSEFLKEYRQITETGGIVTLTFETPPKVTGRVLTAPSRAMHVLPRPTNLRGTAVEWKQPPM